MFRRPLLLVIALTVGDYFLWNWSLNGNHDVLALASGLTLPPLALVSVWLLAVSVARAIGRLTRRPVVAATPERRRSRGYRAQAAPAPGDADATQHLREQPGSRRIAA